MEILERKWAFVAFPIQAEEADGTSWQMSATKADLTVTVSSEDRSRAIRELSTETKRLDLLLPKAPTGDPSES